MEVASLSSSNPITAMPSIRIIAKMPDLPKSPTPIFTLPTPRVNERALLELAHTFKLKAREQARSTSSVASSITYSEGAFDLTLHRASGAFRFKDRNRWQIDHRANVELSDEEAIKRARYHLGRYKLLPADSKVLRVSRLNVAVAGPDRKIQDKRVIDVAVCLQPVIHGVPIDGPGGKVTVYLDHEAKMTCLDHISRRIGPIYRKVTQLHSPEYAIDRAKRIWEKRGVGEVEVNEIRFCYYEMGCNDEQRYLQPAYIVLATLIGADERIKMGDIYVTPAAVNPVGKIEALAIRRRVAQKPRSEQTGDGRPTRRKKAK
jgi:hypothetical protein